MARAKIINDGGSQVVQLPEECRFPEDVSEVEVHGDGRSIVLEAERKGGWSPEFLAVLGAWDEEIERPPQRDISELKDPFE